MRIVTESNGLALFWIGIGLMALSVALHLWKSLYALVGLALSFAGLVITLYSRTDRLLTEIRDLLAQIRDKL